ncbi:MAG: hypothetical protein M1838_004004 [Thelocarpon superellum]|nr:MAG: hypothetical protein M1838_004004 [Thelocarpon superellum]
MLIFGSTIPHVLGAALPVEDAQLQNGIIPIPAAIVSNATSVGNGTESGLDGASCIGAVRSQLSCPGHARKPGPAPDVRAGTSELSPQAKTNTCAIMGYTCSVADSQVEHLACGQNTTYDANVFVAIPGYCTTCVCLASRW